MLYYYCSKIQLPLPHLIVIAFLLGILFLTNKEFRILKNRIGKILFVRERLWYILESLKLYDTDGDRVLNSAMLTFDISNKNVVSIRALLFVDKWTKRLKNLEDNLVAALGLPLLSKKELPNCVIYQLGYIEEIEQYFFNSHTLTREFFADILSPIVKLSNTQQFSLKSNAMLALYGHRQNSGAPVVYTSCPCKRLWYCRGHTSITTTIDTYPHLYPSNQKDLADKLDDLL